MSVLRPIAVAAFLFGVAALGFFAARLTQPGAPPGGGEREIAYWVAPMDPDYRRDEPGKSPMGMDLVPVYVGEEPGAGGAEPSIRIDPAIVNTIGVRTAQVERGDLSRRIETVGFVVPDETMFGHVHVRAAGWIEELLVQTEGETVEAGDVLFRLYSPDLVNAQAEFLQVQRQGNASLIRAGRDRLVALGMTPQQIDALAASGEAGRLTDVRAHHPGTVLKLGVREGMYVEPQTMVMDIADLASVWVEVEIYEDQAAWVAEGQTASMRLPFAPGRTWEGAVDYVYPTVDPVSRTVEVRLVFDNPDGALKPNMYADVTIRAAPEADVVHIPRAALIRTEQSARVILALGEGRFRPAEVLPGIESGDRIEILAGLEAGERIVVSGQFLIDSEASLDTALLRLATPEEEDAGAAPEPAAASNLATAVGRVTALDTDKREVTLEHGPVPELDWPAMTMPFSLADDVPLEAVAEGAAIRFDFRRAETGYEVVSARPAEPGELDVLEGDAP